MSETTHRRTGYLKESLARYKEYASIAKRGDHDVSMDILKCEVFIEIAFQLEEISDTLAHSPLLGVSREDIGSLSSAIETVLDTTD